MGPGVEEAADNLNYWQEELTHPALQEIARSAQAPQAWRQQPGTSSTSRYTPVTSTATPPSATTGEKRRRDGRFLKNKAGLEICFEWNRAEGACSEVCPNQRAHQCEHCLSNLHRGCGHEAAMKGGKGGGAGGRGGGKGKGKEARGRGNW